MSLSATAHVILAGCLWAVAVNALDIPFPSANSGSPVGWRQLKGPQNASPAQNGLADVLYAPDVVLVRLSSSRQDIHATGLAWWSPSHGLWFATDGFPSTLSGRQFELALLIPGSQPAIAGRVEIDADGSARMLSISDRTIEVPRHTTVIMQLREDGNMLSRLRASVVLEGSLQIAGPNRR